MSPLRGLFATFSGSLILSGALLSGCSSSEDPPYYASGGAAGDAPGAGGRSAGGRTSGAGGERSSGGAASGGAETHAGGSGSGGDDASGGAGGMRNGSGGSGTGGNGSGGATTCEGECRFAWPLRGEVSRDWTIANYVDLDPGPGILDFQGGDRSYNGHLGVDIAIASFRKMDQGVPVYAVAPGTVTAVHDGEFDRNTIPSVDGCTAVANSVHVTHVDGREARYLHFRKDSILVEVGQDIAGGEMLGEVGSSGCSSSPHLHIETFEEPGGALVDPFEKELWLDPPDYDAPAGLMEVILVAGVLSSVEDVQTAPPSPATIPSTITFGISVITGGTTPGAIEEITFYQDDAYSFALPFYTFDGTERHYMRWWNVSVDPGDWRAEVSLDGELVESVEFVSE